MKYIIICFLGLVLCQCKSSSDKDKEKAGADSTGTNSPGQEWKPFTVEKISAAVLPASVRFTGKMEEAWKWTDQMGENILVTSRIEPYDDKGKNEFDEEGQTSEIMATHFLKKGTEFTQDWLMKDGVQVCPFDITNHFIPGSTTVTDLDRNGFAEIKVQYLKACRSDVSPSEMRLVIWENGKNYALRGLAWLSYDAELKFELTEQNINLENIAPAKEEYENYTRAFGRYENEREFVSAPPQFLEFAKKEWLKFVREKMAE